MAPPAHIMIILYPAQGHMLPLIDFTHQLVLSSNLTVTIVTTPGNLPAISSLLSAHPSSIQTLILPFPSHPSIPPGIENVRDLGWIGNIYMINALTQLAAPIARWHHAQSDPPVAIISDFFLGWTKKLAEKLNIEHFSFNSSGIFFKSISFYCWNHEEIREMKEFKFCDIPGSPSFKQHELPSLFLLCNTPSPEWKGVREVLIENSLPTNLIMNSFYGLEGRYVDHLRKQFTDYDVYAVGPLSLRGLDHGTAVKDSEFSPLFEWLDSSPAGSVLYVSFGSQKYMNQAQLNAVAMGLEKSGARFVWVVKFQPDECNLPAGFEQRVSGRGVVLKNWAPQMRILRHRAVGGFMCHCGWNSILEATEAGVSILAWPMEAEQYVNAMLLETDLMVAVRVCEGSETVPDADHLSAVIRKWSGESDGALRLRASELKDMAFAAVAAGGSSSNDMEKLSKRLSQLVLARHE